MPWWIETLDFNFVHTRLRMASSLTSWLAALGFYWDCLKWCQFAQTLIQTDLISYLERPRTCSWFCYWKDTHCTLRRQLKSGFPSRLNELVPQLTRVLKVSLLEALASIAPLRHGRLKTQSTRVQILAERFGQEMRQQAFLNWVTQGVKESWTKLRLFRICWWLETRICRKNPQRQTGGSIVGSACLEEPVDSQALLHYQDSHLFRNCCECFQRAWCSQVTFSRRKLSNSSEVSAEAMAAYSRATLEGMAHRKCQLLSSDQSTFSFASASKVINLTQVYLRSGAARNWILRDSCFAKYSFYSFLIS